jgi:hypothetical protein
MAMAQDNDDDENGGPVVIIIGRNVRIGELTSADLDVAITQLMAEKSRRANPTDE